jgi:hypothetical protein
MLNLEWSNQHLPGPIYRRLAIICRNESKKEFSDLMTGTFANAIKFMAP